MHPPVVDLGFEASLFLLVFASMTLAHLTGAVTYVTLRRLERRLER
jgi:hypothetical protein